MAVSPRQADQSAPSGTYEFEENLRRWHKARGTELKIPPIFNRKDMDLLQLWNLVQANGGSREVCRRKLWAAIGRQFHPPPSMTNLSFHVKRIYDKYLLSYEQDVCPEGAMQSVDGEQVAPKKSNPAPACGETKLEAYGSVVLVPTKKRTQVCRPKGHRSRQKQVAHLGKRRYFEDGVRMWQGKFDADEDDLPANETMPNDSVERVQLQSPVLSGEDDDEQQRQELAAQALQQLSGLHTPRGVSPKSHRMFAIASGDDTELEDGLQAGSVPDNIGENTKANRAGQDSGERDAKEQAQDRDDGNRVSDAAHQVWSPSEESQPRSKRQRSSLPVEDHLEEAVPAAFDSGCGYWSGHVTCGYRTALARGMQQSEEMAATPPPGLPIQILPSTVMVGGSKECANRGQDESAQITVAPEGSDFVQPPSTVAMVINNNVNDRCEMGSLVDFYEAHLHKMRREHAAEIAELKALLEKERLASQQKDARIQMLEASKEEIANCFRLLLEKVRPIQHSSETAIQNFRNTEVPLAGSAFQRFLAPRCQAQSDFPNLAGSYGSRYGYRN